MRVVPEADPLVAESVFRKITRYASRLTRNALYVALLPKNVIFTW